MEAAEVEYRGYVIKQPTGPTTASECAVYVESENPHLLSSLLGQHLFEDQHGVERAIRKAKRYIDIILGSRNGLTSVGCPYSSPMLLSLEHWSNSRRLPT